MAPNLAASQHELIRNMIIDGGFTHPEIAWTAECSRDAVKAISANLRRFGSTTAPRNGGGRRRSITPSMLGALREHLIEKPGQYLDELVVFLWDEFEVLVSIATISRALRSTGWSKKQSRRVAKEQNPELRDFYLHNLSSFASYQLVYVDESGCNKRIGFRRTGWSPLGTTPVQTAKTRRGQRFQILPAYTQDGVLLARVFQGPIDGAVFEDFIEELLSLCGRWPERNSVLIMDNASFHHSEHIEQMCDDAGVKLVYLPPYSPDLNPIEEFFAELKSFIKRNWEVYERNAEEDFSAFLEWCLDIVGAKENSAKGHFRHAGLTIEELESSFEI
jgi:transposase